MPTPIDAVGSVTYETGDPLAKAGASKTADKDMFLKLMVAQLKFQNPLEPTSGADFMAQTAQFTMVETLQKLQTAQEASSTWIRMGAAQSMIGQSVDALGADGLTIEGTVQSVRATTAGPKLTIATTKGEVEVDLESITQVHATAFVPVPAPAAASPTASAGSTTSTDTED